MKKALSLLIVCLLVLSMSVVVNAGSYGTISLEKIESTVDISSTIDEHNPNGYYTVKVYMEDLYAYDEIPNFVGYNNLELHINYDPAVFTAGIKSVNSRGKVVYTYSSASVLLPTLDSNGEQTTAMSIKSSNPTAGEITIVASAGLNDQVIEGTDLGDGVFCEIYLAPISADATGVSELTFGKIAFGGSGGIGHIDVQTKVAGYIDLGEEVIPDPDPVATTVKTFPKRFYEVDSQTLTTVGLILEGDDYVETATAGIYANGEAFEAAPIAGAEGKSYILVGLKGVTETSKINLGTATQAYVNLGAEDIVGAEVTDYTSDATEVVADADDFKE